MQTAKILKTIQNHIIREDNKDYIACSMALKLAADYKIPSKTIGDICNENNIKIKNCQLGCF